MYFVSLGRNVAFSTQRENVTSNRVILNIVPMLGSCQTVQSESTDENHKSMVECSKQNPDSDAARCFCPQHTIWQRGGRR